MSAGEEVPTLEEFDTESEREGWLVDVFRDLTWREHWRRKDGHKLDGYFAEWAGDPKCEALGHRHPDKRLDDFIVDGEVDQDAYDAAMDDWDEAHPQGWDGRICEATKWGAACTLCEGECEYTAPPLLWELSGVKNKATDTQHTNGSQ